MSAFVDTNILVRDLTGEPAGMAARATSYREVETDLLLTDLVVAETVYVLESFYEAPRVQVAEAIRSLLAFESMVSVDRRCCCAPSRCTRPIGSTSPRRT